MDIKEKKKGPWHEAKERIEKIAIEKAKNMGYNGITMSNIIPKTIRDNPNHILLMGYEFTGKHLFVLFDKNWDQMVDINNNLTAGLVFYTGPICKNYEDVYTSLDIHEYGPYVVPISEFNILPSKVEVKKEIQPEIKFESNSIISTESSKTDKLLDLESLNADYKALFSAEEEDEHLSTMTIRDLLSIIQCVPVSTKDWLNQEIRKINVIRNKN